MNSLFYILPVCVVMVVGAVAAGYVYLIVIAGVTAIIVSAWAIYHENQKPVYWWDQ